MAARLPKNEGEEKVIIVWRDLGEKPDPNNRWNFSNFSS
jgi:hypothetical protein